MGVSGIKEIRWSEVKEIAPLLLSLSYLYATGVGLLYSAVLYRRFGIHIYDYGEISDFLLAGLRPIILLLAVGQAVVVIYFSWLAGRSSSRSTSSIIIGGIFLVFFVTIVATYFTAHITANGLMFGKDSGVDVHYRSYSGTAGQVTEHGLKLIGSTQRAVFFYDLNDKDDEKDNHTLVVPQAQIVSIEVPE